MQKHFLILVPSLSMLGGCIEPSEDLHERSSAEMKFLELHGERAVLIAPGVYEMVDDQARVLCFSFGRSGMRFDHAQALQELSLARAQRAGQAHDLTRPVSDTRLDFLESKIASLEEAGGPTALGTGDVPLCGVYGSADAYLPYNSAYINAEASVNVSGPVQPGITLAWAWAESGASGIREMLKKRGLALDGTARLYANASAGPDFCYRGKAEALVNPFNCPDDYARSYVEFETTYCTFDP